LHLSSVLLADGLAAQGRPSTSGRLGGDAIYGITFVFSKQLEPKDHWPLPLTRKIGAHTMPNEPESPKAPELDESKTSETAETKEMDRIANKAAGKALRTEERYDRDRSMPPKGGPSGVA
jgi:hypothetical protein